MQKVIVIVLLFAVLAGVAPRIARAQATARTTTADMRAEEVRRLSSEEVEAFIQKDLKTMARLWSDDFVVTDPANTFLNKQQLLGMVESGPLVITSYDRHVDYLRTYGDMVIVAGHETIIWVGMFPHAGKTEHLRFTGMWMKQDGRWREIARHASIASQ